ncbi:hypothetical protein ACXJJ3_32645 [Kribbella sp. WER1]
MTEEQFEALGEAARYGYMGEEFEIECNYTEGDHFHAKRVGKAGSGLAARGGLMMHAGPRAAVCYFAAPQLRQIAAQLLNIADEIDGTVPLSFIDGAPNAEG